MRKSNKKKLLAFVVVFAMILQYSISMSVISVYAEEDPIEVNKTEESSENSPVKEESVTPETGNTENSTPVDKGAATGTESTAGESANTNSNAENSALADNSTVSVDGTTGSTKAAVIKADNLRAEIKAAGIQPGTGPITLTINKEWDDNDNEAGLRPTEITVTLYQYEEGQDPTSGNALDTVTLTEQGNWTGTIEITEHIINAQESKQYKYAFVEDEDEIRQYSYSEVVGSHVDPDVFFEFETIVNWEHNAKPNDKPVVTDITVNPRSVVAMKSTANGHDGVIVWTPEALTQFEQDIIKSNLPNYIGDSNVLFVYGTSGTYTVAGHSQHIFSIDNNVIKFGNGIAQAAHGIYKRSTPDQLIGTIVNKVETTTATIVKNWDDADNQDGKRPTDLTVTLSNGTEVTLNEENSWTATVENLPKFDEKGDITYSWTEPSVDGYELTETTKEGTTTTFTNTHTPETLTISGVKEWVDENNKDGIRPGSVTIKIIGSDGNEYTVETDANWSWIIENLPKYAVGKVGEEVTYEVSEIAVDGYTAEIVQNEDGTYTVTNTHTPEPEPTPTPVNPDNPTDNSSDNPTDNAASQSNAVATGDNISVWLYVMLMAATVMASVGALFLRRKEN